MSQLGTPVSNKFQIGNAEVRIGPMSSANKLTQANSVGLLQSATVNFNQESVDLEGGLPKTLIDTVITKTNVTVTANAYEYSRRNIRAMVNEGSEAAGSVTEYNGAIAVDYTIGTTSTEVIETTLLLADVTVGDMLVVYPVGAPEQLSVVKVTAKVARTAPNASMAKITIDGTKTPMLFNVVTGAIIYKANQIGLGNTTATNYFSLSVIGMEHSSGRPTGFNFWKCAVSGGMEYSFNNDNFAVTPLTFKVLQPSGSDYAASAALEHLAGIIPSHPYGMLFTG